MWTGGIPGSLNQTRVTGALHTEAERCGQPVISEAHPLLAALGEVPSIHGHRTSPCSSEAPSLVSVTEKVTCDAQQLTASTPCLSRHVLGWGGDRKLRGWCGSREVHTLNTLAWLTPSPKLKPSCPCPPVIWDQLGSPWLSYVSHDVRRKGTL